MKKVDILIVIICPIIATIATVLFSTNLFISIFLYFGLPSLYIAIRNPGIITKSLSFALIFFIPLSLFFDTLSAINGAYIISNSIFPFRIFGISTIELYIYAFFWILFPILFYEHFLDRGKKKDTLSSWTKYLFYGITVLASAVVVFLYANPDLLHIPYCYFIMALFFIFITLVAFLLYYPKLILKYVFVACYFFFFMFIFELAALHNHQWIFPGQFIGMVSILHYQFPFEEFFFWMIFGTPAILMYYELFADDRK